MGLRIARISYFLCRDALSAKYASTSRRSVTKLQAWKLENHCMTERTH